MLRPVIDDVGDDERKRRRDRLSFAGPRIGWIELLAGELLDERDETTGLVRPEAAMLARSGSGGTSQS
jgi:hypothetical protein